MTVKTIVQLAVGKSWLSLTQLYIQHVHEIMAP